jgi:hypothetical protein
MTARLSFLTLASLVLLLLSVMFSCRAHELNVPFILFLFSLAVIAYTIYSDIDFNITGHVLFVDHRFQGQLKYDLKQLRQWEEIGYPIRGQRRATLVLVFDQERTVELTNKDHKKNYETVFKRLRQEFPLIEKFNMTILQEIKFKAVHDYLTTDFYPQGTSSQTDVTRNKRFSIDIFRMKTAGVDRNQISEKLLAIKIENMGEHETISKCKQVADRVMEI